MSSNEWTQFLKEIAPKLKREIVSGKILNELNAIHPNGPTQIQKSLLTQLASINNENGAKTQSFVICSKTGTGKTLTFGIPAMNTALNSLNKNQNGAKRPKPESTNEYISAIDSNSGAGLDLNQMLMDRLTDEKSFPISCLILAPSRELCAQIKKHLVPVADSIGLRIMSLTGGVSHSKQKRVVENSPNIVIGTPGRILEFANMDPCFANSLKQLDTLVFDEADKLFDESSFTEVKNILEIMKYREKSMDKIQIFVVSATIYSVDGETNSSAKKYLKKITHKLGLTKNFRVINHVDQKALPESLEEFKICCIDDNKDLYLLHLLKTHLSTATKLIIFVNSKERLKKLHAKLKLLDYKASSLSSGLNQHQRNENLRAFKTGKANLLLTTDLAARGFDIEDVHIIVHYDVPFGQEQYIHRCGRSARKGKSGTSYLLLGAEEFSNFKEIAAKIGSNAKNLTVMPRQISQFRERSNIVNGIVSAKKAKSNLEGEMEKFKALNDTKMHKKCLQKLKVYNSEIELLKKQLDSIQ